MAPTDTRAPVTTGRFAVCVAAILAIFALTLGAIVALQIANRPVGTVVWLTTAVAVPTALGLLNYATNRQIRYDLHNGVQESIAAKAAAAVRTDAAVVAAELAASPPSSSGGIHAP